ncbi:MAG: DUF6744 family protein [Candidatus Paceibacterota bacterium]
MTANGLVIMGYFFWWSIREVLVKKVDFLASCKKVGIKYDIKDCDRTAYLNAVRQVKQQQGQHHVLVRMIAKDKDQHLVGLVDEKVDPKAQDLQYHHSATMSFNQKTGLLTCDHPHRAFDLIKDKYNSFKENLTSYDMRLIIKDIIDKMTPVTVREGGGIYYADEKFTRELKQVEALLKSLEGCSMVLVPQINTEDTKKAIYNSLMEDMNRRLDNFQEEINNNKFSTPKGWAATLERFRETKKEVEFYAERLKFSGENVLEKLNAMENQVKAKLMEL